MNIKELEFYFEQNDVPNEYYEIDELGEVVGVGRIDDRWATYYSERGKKRSIKYFDTEDEACDALIVKVSRRIERETGRPLPPYSSS